jgi:enoyl-CoA hydratase/carnithine racemase
MAVSSTMASEIVLPYLPASLRAEQRDDGGILWLGRSEKPNALDDQTILRIETYFANLGHGIKAVVLASDNDNFSAGLGLSELSVRGINDGIEQSRLWQPAAQNKTQRKIRC